MQPENIKPLCIQTEQNVTRKYNHPNYKTHHQLKKKDQWSRKLIIYESITELIPLTYQTQI